MNLKLKDKINYIKKVYPKAEPKLVEFYYNIVSDTVVLSWNKNISINEAWRDAYKNVKSKQNDFIIKTSR